MPVDLNELCDDHPRFLLCALILHVHIVPGAAVWVGRVPHNRRSNFGTALWQHEQASTFTDRQYCYAWTGNDKQRIQRTRPVDETSGRRTIRRQWVTHSHPMCLLLSCPQLVVAAPEPSYCVLCDLVLLVVEFEVCRFHRHIGLPLALSWDGPRQV